MSQMTRFLEIAGLALALIAIACCSGCGWFQQMQQRRAKVYADLQQLCDGIPIPVGLQKKGSQDMIKPEGGVFTNNFETELSCDAATSPMYEYFISKGW